MSKQSVDEVIQRASTDVRFRNALGSNFDATLRPYGLTSEERAQLASALGIQVSARVHSMPSAVATSVEASSVEASSVEASSVEASSVEASSVEASSVEASSVEASSVEASSVEAS